jgi:hypothetical protein
VLLFECSGFGGHLFWILSSAQANVRLPSSWDPWFRSSVMESATRVFRLSMASSHSKVPWRWSRSAYFEGVDHGCRIVCLRSFQRSKCWWIDCSKVTAQVCGLFLRVDVPGALCSRPCADVLLDASPPSWRHSVVALYVGHLRSVVQRAVSSGIVSSAQAALEGLSAEGFFQSVDWGLCDAALLHAALDLASGGKSGLSDDVVEAVRVVVLPVAMAVCSERHRFSRQLIVDALSCISGIFSRFPAQQILDTGLAAVVVAASIEVLSSLTKLEREEPERILGVLVYMHAAAKSVTLVAQRDEGMLKAFVVSMIPFSQALPSLWEIMQLPSEIVVRESGEAFEWICRSVRL